MTEGLFILTTIFVAYVVYVIVNESKTTPKPKPAESDRSHSEPTIQAVTEPVVKRQSVAEVATPVSKPSPSKKSPSSAKPAAKSAKPASKASAPVTETASVANSGKKGLKDPVSGEVATAYSNYRFTKRWIKDALVAEGLLPKVYKNTELDETIEAQIKEAVLKLESLAKYQP